MARICKNPPAASSPVTLRMQAIRGDAVPPDFYNSALPAPHPRSDHAVCTRLRHRGRPIAPCIVPGGPGSTVAAVRRDLEGRWTIPTVSPAKRSGFGSFKIADIFGSVRGLVGAGRPTPP